METTETQSTTRTDHNVWIGLSYDEPHAARAWLRGLGFTEGDLIEDADGHVQHSEMLWPEGGRVMVSSRAKTDDTFVAGGGVATVYVVCDDPDAVWARAETLDARVVREMEDTDYGSRGFSIEDVEGNSWSFGTYGG